MICFQKISHCVNPLALAIKIWFEVKIVTIWFLTKIAYPARDPKVIVTIGNINDLIVKSHPWTSGYTNCEIINPLLEFAINKIIGAMTNEGKPIKITTNKLITTSIHLPRL